MEFDLADKRIVVTGGSSGIGRATVRLLAAEGASTLSVARSEPIERLPGEETLTVDLSAAGADDEIAAAVASRWGGCDGLAAVAGVMRMTDDGVLGPSDSQWRDTWETNFLGTVRALRAVVPAMKASGGGSIVLMSSVRAALPDFRQPDYSVTKAAIRSLAKMAANELAATGIRVNSVSPGAIRTEAWDEPGGVGDALSDRHGLPRDEAIAYEMGSVRGVPAGRMGMPDEVAAVVGFLLSPRSGYTTGADYSADGGYVRAL